MINYEGVRMNIFVGNIWERFSKSKEKNCNSGVIINENPA